VGVEYSFYLEAHIDGKWECICPRFKNENGELFIHNIISGKSSMRALWDEYCSSDVVPCDELAAYHEGCYGFRLFDYERALKYVYGHRAANFGYVEKRLIDAYQSGDCDCGIYEYLTADDFRELNPEEQKAYAYFDGTNGSDELGLLREIIIIVGKYKEMYACEHDWGIYNAPHRIVASAG